MIIEQVDLINFKKYAQERIILGKKVLGIFGANGSGKSSIFDAVCWCLYGVTPTMGKEGQNVKQDELIRDGQEDMGVEVTFRYDGQTYNVHRFLRKDGVSSAVRLEGELVARSSKEVTAYIAKTLGLDAKAFISASFIRQNEIDLLTSQRASKRKEIINRLFNLQLYDQFNYDTKELKRSEDSGLIKKEEEISSLKREMDNYSVILCDERGLSDKLSQHKKRILSLKADLERLEIEKGKLDEAIDELGELKNAARGLSERKRGLEESIGKMNENILEAESARKEHESLKSNIADLRGKRERLDAIAPIRERYNELCQVAKELLSRRGISEQDHKSRLSSIDNKMGALRSKRDMFAKEAGDLEKDIEGIFDDHVDPDVIELEIERSRSELEKINSRIGRENQELTKMLTIAEKLEKDKELISSIRDSSVCPTCRQPLEEETRMGILSENELGLKKSSAMISRQKNKLGRLEELWEGSQKRLSDLLEKHKEAKALDRALSKKKHELDMAKRNLRDAELSISEAIEERKALESAHLSRISSLNEEIRTNSDSIEKLDYDDELYGTLNEDTKDYEKLILRSERLHTVAIKEDDYRKEARELRSELELIENDLEGKQGSISELSKVKGKLDRVIIAMKDIEGSISTEKVNEGEINQQIRSNDKFKSLLGQTRERLRVAEDKKRSIRDSIKQYTVLSDAFRNIPINIHERLKPIIQTEVSRLLDTITQGKYPAVMIDEDYTLQVSHNGIFYPIYRFSGGEKDLINLCLRIGISRVLVSLSKEQGFAHLESLFLDETFSSLDADRRRNLMATLNKLENFFSQIIIITHVEDIKEMIPEAMIVAENDDGTAVVTRMT